MQRMPQKEFPIPALQGGFGAVPARSAAPSKPFGRPCCCSLRRTVAISGYPSIFRLVGLDGDLFADRRLDIEVDFDPISGQLIRCRSGPLPRAGATVV